MKSLYLLFLGLLFSFPGIGQQQTMGLLANESTAFNGYTLFSPNSFGSTYLIDNCGELINSWDTPFTPGLIAYLTTDGRLVRTGRLGGNFTAGGAGGKIEIYTWDGILEWSWDYASPLVHAHHDIEILPNGNILLVAWELRTQEEAIQAGRDPLNITPVGIWPDHILEITPIGSDQANIVWEWHVWDHLIQDLDPDKDNFGVISDHPERIDINYEFGSTGEDFTHTNSLDYNPTTDQIMLSVRSFNEIWIIDHSTTIQEAADSIGGNYGKGGDLLYRYGNPNAYKRGAVSDQKLFAQHDAKWIPEGMPNAGKVMVFNNGFNRADGNYSSVDIFDPPVLSDGSFIDPGAEAYGPENLFRTFVSSPPQAFFAPNMSGASPLPNGNILACIAFSGQMLEIDPDDFFVWEYVNPINAIGPMTQGTSPFGNSVFKVERYSPDYPAFIGRDLSPQGPIELNPVASNCIINDSTTSTIEVSVFRETMILPNPAFDQIQIQNIPDGTFQFQLFTGQGKRIKAGSYIKGENISIIDLPKGLYFLTLKESTGQLPYTLKFLKL